LYRRLGGLQGGSEQVLKISTPLGFDPWTVQSVTSRYKDYAALSTKFTIHEKNLYIFFLANYIENNENMIMGYENV
jgi:hypothetical protein